MAATSEQAVARATDKLGETPEKMRDMPDELRKALKAKADDPKVEDIRDDILKACEQPDIYLLRFLRVRKYDVEAAVSNVIGWFRWLNVQQKLPTDLMKVFSDGQEQSAEKADGADLTYWGCKAADVKDVLESDAFGVLPGYTKDGSKCMCISDVGAMIGLMKIHPVKKVMLSTTYLLEQLSFDPNVQVCGLALLYDCENYSLSLLKELMKRKDFMELQKKKAAAMQDAYPFRFAEMWMVDPPWYFNLMWAVVRLFLKKKLRDRIHLLSKSKEADLNKIRAKFDRAQLPQKFGGDLTSEQSQAAMKEWVAERIKIEEGRV